MIGQACVITFKQNTILLQCWDRNCTFILLCLHLQDGTASLYTIVIFILSIVFHLFHALSLAVSLFQIYAKKKILKAFLCLYYIILWIPVPADPSTLSLSPVTCPVHPWALFARASPGSSSPPCFLCSCPRSGQTMFAWTELGGFSWPMQITQVCYLRYTFLRVCIISGKIKIKLYTVHTHIVL